MLKNANWGTVQPFCFSSQRNGAFIEFNVESKSSGEPMVDFHKYFNSENIVTLQEDLVTWINVGMVRVFPPVYLDSYGGMYSFSLLLKIRLTPRLQPLLPGIILYLKSPFRFSSTCSISLNLSTSFMLTPVNYFDYDITMESRNVVLIHPIQERDDCGLKQNFHRLSDDPPNFEYTGIGVAGVDRFVDSERLAEIRRAQDMFVRLNPIEAPNKAF